MENVVCPFCKTESRSPWLLCCSRPECLKKAEEALLIAAEYEALESEKNV